MSEQSGPITREQVERAIAKPRNIDYRMPLWWREWAPDYVIAAEAADDWDAVHAALTRWRDELAAAEPVRRVARWSEADGLYRLDPPHEYQIGDGDCRAYLVSRVQAIAWGYEIEGSPIRKVARWDATRGAYVALDAHGTVCMITTERAQAIDWGYDPEGGPEPVRDWKSDRAEGADRVIAAIGRPAPRFKVGDRVTSGLGGPWKIGRVEWGRLVPEADCDEWVYHHASGNVSACESVLALAWTPTPASPPAPEVVDVPQPTVKRCACPDIHDDVEAEWRPGEPYLTVTHTTVPLALLRAMLEAIDAQQGGA